MSRDKWGLVAVVLGGLALATAGFSDDLDGETIAEIQIDGLEHTKRYVVERELRSRVGEPFSRKTLIEDGERLDRLGLFSSIDTDAVVVDSGVRIELELRETLPYLPTVSIQVNDENGTSAGPGFKSVNFLGRGIELNAAAQFGGSTNLDLSLTNPWFAGDHLSYHVRYLHQDRPNVLDDFHEIADGVQVRFGSYIGERGRIGAIGGFQGIESDQDGVTLSPDNQDHIASLGVYVGYDTRDIWSRPHRGWWSEIDVTHSDVLDTEGSFWTTNIDVRRYGTWKERNTVLLTSLTTLQNGTLGFDIPIYEDFHIGGTNTIRGWALDSQSGKNQFINTVEYRFLVTEPRPFSLSFFTAYIGLQLAAFGDFGQAWTAPDDFGLSELLDGYGVGLRVLIPFVDEVRLDVAWGQPGEGLTFHFGIYPKAVM